MISTPSRSSIDNALSTHPIFACKQQALDKRQDLVVIGRPVPRPLSPSVPQIFTIAKRAYVLSEAQLHKLTTLLDRMMSSIQATAGSPDHGSFRCGPKSMFEPRPVYKRNGERLLYSIEIKPRKWYFPPRHTPTVWRTVVHLLRETELNDHLLTNEPSTPPPPLRTNEEGIARRYLDRLSGAMPECAPKELQLVFQNRGLYRSPQEQLEAALRILRAEWLRPSNLDQVACALYTAPIRDCFLPRTSSHTAEQVVAQLREASLPTDACSPPQSVASQAAAAAAAVYEQLTSPASHPRSWILRQERWESRAAAAAAPRVISVIHCESPLQKKEGLISRIVDFVRSTAGAPQAASQSIDPAFEALIRAAAHRGEEVLYVASSEAEEKELSSLEVRHPTFHLLRTRFDLRPDEINRYVGRQGTEFLKSDLLQLVRLPKTIQNPQQILEEVWKRTVTAHPLPRIGHFTGESQLKVFLLFFYAELKDRLKHALPRLAYMNSGSSEFLPSTLFDLMRAAYRQDSHPDFGPTVELALTPWRLSRRPVPPEQIELVNKGFDRLQEAQQRNRALQRTGKQ